uniref:26S proteasome non-ATPase regulatory subunit 2 n=1 Tax=Spumella elongata TaxID=89044 RepID=A0A7S3HCL3_9STRA|mmetsp:Transcript_44048/g.76773  ORF Transcript_44048/g.76773 Transcript_44048/m.76773 type:complete len:894 (+) Transcript_44048:28-2709(+)
MTKTDKKEPIAVAVTDEKKKGTDKPVPEELSEEDKALKEGLELAVTRLREDDTSLHKQALDHLINEIKSSTSSMTSVPKPLKFLRSHYGTLKSVYESWPLMHSLKRLMADVLSVLGMTMAEPGSRECLRFKLQGTQVNVSSWGHEYVRSLAGEISEEYNSRMIEAPADDDVDVDDLMTLVDDIVPFQMKHNAEAEAVDLLVEVRQLNKLVETPVVDERNYERVCLYLIRSAQFIADPDDLETLFDTAYAIYKAQKKYTDALRVAIKIDSNEKIAELFSAELGATSVQRSQMALILARAHSAFALEDDDKLNELIGNANLAELHQAVIRDLDLGTPRTPEEVYKTAAVETRGLGSRIAANTAVDSARANLASTFVNAFVNAAHCSDKLMISGTAEDTQWLFKNKGHGMLSCAASLGMLMMWNVEEGLNQIDKFFHDGDDFVKSGACLGVGIISSGVRNESDAALALLTDYLDDSAVNVSTGVRTASAMGLGLAYAGAQREEVKELLEGIIGNTDVNILESSMAALSLALVFTGTCNDDIGSVILQRLMESSDADLTHTASRFMCLGLGLLYLGKGERVEAVLEAVRTIEHARGRYAEVTLETCAYAGTGNVLKVQSMLRRCTDHLTENAEHQAVAVLGIALTNIGEEIGSEMTLRTFEHLLHYGELPVRRAVPLALALLYLSHPDYSVVDQLSRLSHDADADIAQCAILGLGLVAGGTNNARVTGLLRQLAEFYAKEANHLFIVRIAQGLVAMGKGLLSISPFHSDRFLLDGPGVGGILAVLHACLDLKNTILDKLHYVLYFLTPAMHPRYLALIDEAGKLVKTSVRVGQAVETVGQAGRPKTITGFQTHTTPVLLGFKDRAELAGGEYTSASSVMEGVVIAEKIEVPEGTETK